MDELDPVGLLTLWFVVLIFIHTAAGGDGPVITAIGYLALFLAYVLPFVIIGSLLGALVED